MWSESPCRRRPIAIAPRIDSFRRRAVDRTVRDVGRVGKRVVVHLDSGDAIVLEPRMTGLVLVADPPTREHLRFRCTFSGNGASELLYWDRRGLGSVRLFSPKEFEAAFGHDKLGPDALAMTGELFRDQLGGSQRAMKVALLDQRAVAGIGNLYASEILHLAGIHPARRCNRITRAQWQAIADATHAVLEGGDPLRRFDAGRRHLPQCPQPGRRLPESPPRVRQSGPGMPALR